MERSERVGMNKSIKTKTTTFNKMSFEEKYNGLKEMLRIMESNEFVETFWEWLNNHDDTDIEGWSDVITTLYDECYDVMTTTV